MNFFIRSAQILRHFQLFFTFIVLIVAIILATIAISYISRANSISWTSSLPAVVESTATNTSTSDHCAKTTEHIEKEVEVVGLSQRINACTNQGEAVKFGTGLHPDTYTLVSFIGDRKMYIVTNFACGDPHPYCTYLPAQDTLISLRQVGNSYYGTEFTVYKNFSNRLSPVQHETFGKAYSFDSSNPDYKLKPSDDARLPMRNIGISPSGQWITLPIENIGLFRLNIDNLTLRKFSNTKPTHQLGFSQSHEHAITNDGARVFIAGQNVTPEIYDIDNTCGQTFGLQHTYTQFHANIPNPCPSVTLGTNPNLIGAPSLRHIQGMRFDENGGEVEFYTIAWDYKVYRVVLRANGYIPPSLSYLALGDSFSSGEGDTQRNSSGQKFYREYTDRTGNDSQPEEKCHISTRSYPYQLAAWMSLTRNTPKQWDTIACSGAEILDVIPEDRVTDLGQGNRLEGFNHEALKHESLNEIIPGRVKQIEFVKKYKPQTVTLTMGGNDVGFGDKILNCVVSPMTCIFARDDYRAKLRSEIQSQFTPLVNLYRDLATKGDSNAKVYVLGYPQFINKDQSATCPNTGLLDVAERELIMESVSYMNAVIEAAAKRAGVKYIDIEDSFGNHKLCDSENEKYVTAISGIGGFNGNEKQESFHPNAKGHTAIANYIKSARNLDNIHLLDYETCPGEANSCPDTTITVNSVPVPEYFQHESGIFTNLKYMRVTIGDPIAGAGLAISLRQFYFLPGFPVTVTLFSDPTPLGGVAADENGSLDATVIIPADTPPGYHTITLQGQTYSGEPVEYEQVILVKSSEPNDPDGDGIDSASDPCEFIPATNEDIDQDSIDDACDPEIGEPLVTEPEEPNPEEPTVSDPPADPDDNETPQQPTSQSTIITLLQNALSTVVRTFVQLFTSVFNILQYIRF